MHLSVRIIFVAAGVLFQQACNPSVDSIQPGDTLYYLGNDDTTDELAVDVVGKRNELVLVNVIFDKKANDSELALWVGGLFYAPCSEEVPTQFNINQILKAKTLDPGESTPLIGNEKIRIVSGSRATINTLDAGSFNTRHFLVDYHPWGLELSEQDEVVYVSEELGVAVQETYPEGGELKLSRIVKKKNNADPVSIADYDLENCASLFTSSD